MNINQDILNKFIQLDKLQDELLEEGRKELNEYERAKDLGETYYADLKKIENILNDTDRTEQILNEIESINKNLKETLTSHEYKSYWKLAFAIKTENYKIAQLVKEDKF